MHEAGLAKAIVAALYGRDLEGRRVRVYLRGGHEDSDALRAYLTAAPWIGTVELVRQPVPRACVRCAVTFLSAESAPSCPACGGAAWPLPPDEAVEIELIPTKEAADVPGAPHTRATG